MKIKIEELRNFTFHYAKTVDFVGVVARHHRLKRVLNSVHAVSHAYVVYHLVGERIIYTN